MGAIYDFRNPTIRVEITSIFGQKFEFVRQKTEGDIIGLTTHKSIDEVAVTGSMTIVARDNFETFRKD